MGASKIERDDGSIETLQKAMKKAHMAQCMLQEAMEDLALQVNDDNGKQKSKKSKKEHHGRRNRSHSRSGSRGPRDRSISNGSSTGTSSSEDENLKKFKETNKQHHGHHCCSYSDKHRSISHSRPCQHRGKEQEHQRGHLPHPSMRRGFMDFPDFRSQRPYMCETHLAAVRGRQQHPFMRRGFPDSPIQRPHLCERHIAEIRGLEPHPFMRRDVMNFKDFDHRRFQSPRGRGCDFFERRGVMDFSRCSDGRVDVCRACEMPWLGRPLEEGPFGRARSCPRY